MVFEKIDNDRLEEDLIEEVEESEGLNKGASIAVLKDQGLLAQKGQDLVLTKCGFNEAKKITKEKEEKDDEDDFFDVLDLEGDSLL